jgi:hypothetical protein
MEAEELPVISKATEKAHGVTLFKLEPGEPLIVSPVLNQERDRRR